MQIEILDHSVDPLYNITVAAKESTNTFYKDDITKRELFVKGLIRLGHNSCIEQAWVQIRVSGISRGCIDQLARYRHASFVVQSQRRVDMENAKFIHPLSVQKVTDACYDMEKTMKKFYKALVAAGVPREDARYYLGMGFESAATFTCNFWTLRHIIEQRAAKDAQWEIRELALQLKEMVKEKGWGWLIEDLEC